MIAIFLILAGILTYFSWRSWRGGVAYFAFVRDAVENPKSLPATQPFVSILAPCRGNENGLAENLARLFEQDYRQYEIVFIVDDEKDAAAPIIRQLIATRQSAKVSASLVVAGRAVDEGQKVHNLRTAVGFVRPESYALVFVDSDARPDSAWLAALVAPLSDRDVGATTGYRWFIGEKFSFATELRAVWNASIATALGPNEQTNFCWGGSMAVRRDVFEELGVAEHWRGTVSDDFVVTRVMQSHGRGIRFVPQALAASVGNCNLREMFEFTTRQMKITRVYASSLWLMSLIGSALFVIVWLWSGLILLTSGSTSFTFLAAAFVLLINFLLGAAKAHLRLKAIEVARPQLKAALRRQTFWQLSLWTVTPFIFLLNTSIAAFSRTINWRGVRYRLVTDNRTEVLPPAESPR